jgi:hypothetical protein
MYPRAGIRPLDHFDDAPGRGMTTRGVANRNCLLSEPPGLADTEIDDTETLAHTASLQRPFDSGRVWSRRPLVRPEPAMGRQVLDHARRVGGRPRLGMAPAC